jgi:hypothetical protein
VAGNRGSKKGGLNVSPPALRARVSGVLGSNAWPFRVNTSACVVTPKLPDCIADALKHAKTLRRFGLASGLLSKYFFRPLFREEKRPMLIHGSAQNTTVN